VQVRNILNKLGRRQIVLALAVVLPLIILVLALTASQIGITSEIGNGGLPLAATDLSAVPPSVTNDATRIAAELLGDGQSNYNDFVNQLLGVYLEAKDKDFVVLFNPGGWGWNLVEASPGWQSIFDGIESELADSGYTSLLLTYQRTFNTLQGRVDEAVEMLTGYSSKSKDLACRVEFLTSHIPDLKVIIAGESNGTIIVDQTMNLLANNQQVYSIQTGPPFWHQNIMLDRTLIMTDNGMVPDSFSQGDFLAMAGANLRALFGVPRPEDNATVFLYVRAPGHEYWWQHPGVYSQIENFLGKNFGTAR
jgi:hypothetical protein